MGYSGRPVMPVRNDKDNTTINQADNHEEIQLRDEPY